MLLVSETAAYNFFPPSLDGTIYAPPMSRRYYVYCTVMILEGGAGGGERSGAGMPGSIKLEGFSGKI